MSSLPLVVEKTWVSQLEVWRPRQGVVHPPIVNLGLVEDYIGTILSLARQFLRLNGSELFSVKFTRLCSLTFPGYAFMFENYFLIHSQMFIQAIMKWRQLLASRTNLASLFPGLTSGRNYNHISLQSLMSLIWESLQLSHRERSEDTTSTASFVWPGGYLPSPANTNSLTLPVCNKYFKSHLSRLSL